MAEERINGAPAAEGPAPSQNCPRRTVRRDAGPYPFSA